MSPVSDPRLTPDQIDPDTLKLAQWLRKRLNPRIPSSPNFLDILTVIKNGHDLDVARLNDQISMLQHELELTTMRLSALQDQNLSLIQQLSS